MQQIGPIYSLTADDSITLYWDLPEEAPDGLRYEIIQDGRSVGITDRTHFTLAGLEADTAYNLQVRADGCGYGEVLTVSTGRRRERIDVTLPPYSARGDGQTLNTDALRQAFRDCGPNQQLYFPAGVYLTGALQLHSYMEIYLDEGAVLQGTDCPEDYLPRILSRFEGTELSCYSSLLNLGELDRNGGYSCTNVLIRGKGTIASGGQVLAERVIASEREALKGYLAELGDRVRECENENTIPGRVRPRLINMSNCRDIVLEGVTLRNGASWNVHMIYSDHIVTHDCTFYSEGVWNGDGWDPDSSTNCTIFGCTFYTGDDSVAIKSGKNPEGNEVNRPSAHIRIFDCRTAFGHGICIGSEMSGGVEDVRIWNCDLENSLCGVEIKGTPKRGGYVRNVHVRNVTTPRVLFHSVSYNDDGEPAPEQPVFEGCSFEKMSITGRCQDHEHRWKDCDAVELIGFDRPGHELRDIRFRDITFGSEQAERPQTIALRHCGNISLENIRCV